MFMHDKKDDRAEKDGQNREEIDALSEESLDLQPEEDSSRLIVEDEVELGAIGSVQAKLKKIKDELNAVKSERQEYLDGWQRAKADAINARKESFASMERSISRIKEGMVEDILPVLDSFDMAIGSDAWNTIDSSWSSGIEHIRNQLLDVLTRYGIERYSKVGDQYDHALHEAVQEADDVPGDSGSVVRILRYGYKSADRIVRPAQVIIKK